MVSDVIPNTVDGSPSIAIAVPVKVDGVLRGVLTARLEHEDLSRLLAEQQARAGGVAVILDRSERIVARSRDAGKFFGTEAPDYFKELLLGAPRGAAPSRSLEGNPVLTAWERLPFGWTVAIGIPSGGQVASFANTIYALGALGFVLLVVSVLGVVAFSRRVRGELIEISGQTHRLSAGEPIPSRHFTFRELDDVYAAMRDASQRVAGLVGSLRNSESVAHERLAALEQGDKRKDAFLAMLAHELRNPLAPIRTAAETLRRPAHGPADDRAGPRDHLAPGDAPQPPGRRPARRFAHHAGQDRAASDPARPPHGRVGVRALGRRARGLPQPVDPVGRASRTDLGRGRPGAPRRRSWTTCCRTH